MKNSDRWKDVYAAWHYVFLTALMYSFASPALAAAGPALAGVSAHALIDVSCADDFKDYALRTRAVMSEWYPKINDILYGPDHALP